MRTRHIMGLSPHPYCNFCGPGCLGTLMHMLWECPDVQDFWDMVLDVEENRVSTFLKNWRL